MSDSYGSNLTSFGAPDTAGGPAFEPQAPQGAPLDLTPPDGEPAGPGPQAPAPQEPEGPNAFQRFGEGLRKMLPGAHYDAPDPQSSALDQASSLLQQRVTRAGSIATNPIAQIFAPEKVAAAREFMPKAAEELSKIEAQKSAIAAGRVQAQTLGLAPGEASDHATQEDRITIASAKALRGNMRAFQGLQAVHPERAAAIAPQVYETVARHLDNAQLGFDSLSAMQNEGQYQAKLKQLRQDGTLTELESLGMKVPPNFEAFNATKAMEGRALREARIGINTIGQKLEERNTYQPMEKKEAETYVGRLTTVHGDQITNGTWGRNAASGTRGLVVNGAADPNDLGKKFTLATPEQRKAIKEEFDGALPKTEVDKYREFNRTYDLAVKDGKGNKVPDGKINTNPNVQQGIAEGLASMLRGGHGGANVGLLQIELAKRGWAQGAIDGLVSNYNGALNTMFKDARDEGRPYLSARTQVQIRDVMEALKAYQDNSIGERVTQIAQRAGALGLNGSAFGLGKDEATGAIGSAIEVGRQEQIERMKQAHQAIGGGDGVLQLQAQRPGAGASALPPGAQPANELPGARPLQTPVQQSQQPAPVQPPNDGAPGGSPAAPPPPAPQAPPPVGPGAAGGITPPSEPSLNARSGGVVEPAPVAPNQMQHPPGTGPLPAGPSPLPGTAAPVTVAGQQVNVPLPAGASPLYVAKMQRIESGKEKDPWTATVRAKKADGVTPISSASGAFQMLDQTWKDNRPPGAPDRAKDATPAQQAQALANLAQRDAATLTRNGVPVTDTSLYVAHNLGATGGSRLMTADPSADAREIVGERAAKNNPKFFRGRPTVAIVLERYATEMSDGQVPSAPGETRVAALNTGVANDGSEPPARGGAPGGFNARQRAARENMRTGAPGPDLSAERRPGQWGEAGDMAVEHAPAIGSTVGGIGGFFSPVPGGAAIGGGVGGAAGQALKDYLKGNPTNPKAILKEGALGAVLGVFPEGRPVVGALARTVGAGAVEGTAKAVEPGSDAADVVDAAAKGGALAAGGEMFGRALGMVGHKVYNMFAPDAKAAVQGAAKAYAEATDVLKSEAPKLPGVNGAAGTANPKYQAAEAAKTKSEQTLKDAGLVPEEAAYAHKVSSEGVPKQEAQAARPGALEKESVGQGYQQIEREVGDAGKGAVKETAKPLQDGPITAVVGGKVSQKHLELAQRTEMAITAPAKNWTEKWTQLKEARSQLLQEERDALGAMTPGKTREAADMRKLADTVRAQQEKAAKYVFGAAEGERVMQRLNVLDARYRNLMEATNGGDLAKAAAMKGEAGREAEKKFTAFAAGDPQAVAAFKALRGAKGDAYEATISWNVAAEGIPVIGKVIKGFKLAGMLREWAKERAAGSPVTFAEMVKIPSNAAQWQSVRDILGSTAARAAVSAGQ